MQVHYYHCVIIKLTDMQAFPVMCYHCMSQFGQPLTEYSIHVLQTQFQLSWSYNFADLFGHFIQVFDQNFLFLLWEFTCRKKYKLKPQRARIPILVKPSTMIRQIETLEITDTLLLRILVARESLSLSVCSSQILIIPGRALN